MSQFREETNKYLIAMQEGDPSLFAEFYHRMRGTFGFYAMRILLNQNDWEDVLSESYIKISTRINTFNRTKDGYNWVLKIIENTARTYNEKEWKHPTVELGNLYLPEKVDCFAESELEMDIRNALKKLPSMYTTIAMLYIYKGRTQYEIGKMLGISKPAVCQRLRKIKSVLRESGVLDLTLVDKQRYK